MTLIDRMIDAFRPAEGPPPQTLWPFMKWCLAGAWPALILAACFSAAAGAMEAGTAMILGRVIDSAVSSGSDAFFSVANKSLYRFRLLRYRSIRTCGGLCLTYY